MRARSQFLGQVLGVQPDLDAAQVVDAGPGLDPARGADACWTLVNSLVYDRLVLDRGWSLEDYEDWLVAVVTATLLD